MDAQIFMEPNVQPHAPMVHEPVQEEPMHIEHVLVKQMEKDNLKANNEEDADVQILYVHEQSKRMRLNWQ